MKGITLLLVLVSFQIQTFCQASDYEPKLAQYMAEFKHQAYSDDVRLGLRDKVSSLNDQIKIQIGLMNMNSPDYGNYESTQRKINAFDWFLSCFEHGTCQMRDFSYIMKLFGQYPQENTDLNCDKATFYEVSFEDFKATMVYNPMEYKSNAIRHESISVDYDVILNGKVVQGGSLNVGPGMIRCINYQSDKNKYYHKIVAVRCRDFINN